MDQRRLIAFLIFSFALVMLWDAWMSQRSVPSAVAEPIAQQSASGLPADATVPTPQLDLSDTGELPLVEAAPAPSADRRITVRTDMVTAEISAEGGQIVTLELNQHAASHDDERNFRLFDDGMRHTYFAQSGLIGQGLPNHRTVFELPEGDLTLSEGQDRLELRMRALESDGVEVVKLMTFHRGSYVIDVQYEITNRGEQPLASHAYFQFARDGRAAEAVEVFGVSSFTGPAVYSSGEKYQKIDFSDVDSGKAKFATRAEDGWLAMVQHYFVAAWLPQEGLSRENYVRKVAPDQYTAGVILPLAAVPANATAQVGMQLYAGPQEQDHLDGIAEGLGLVVDYGWLTVIAAPLFWVLSWFHSLTGNWGWAIILVTVLIKLVFFPLSATSYKSMAKMRVLGPRMQRIKELYGNDKQRMQQEMMSMYRSEKINPLGGCLPILVQIPVFIALYWVLLGSVEMRHAPWLGWITDLSAKDPYFILPILMGASMFIQMKLNPAPPDPIQAKIMMALPLVFTVLFLWFPSGLVLYWVVNNLLSIAQQWQITRMIENEKKAGKPA